MRIPRAAFFLVPALAAAIAVATPPPAGSDAISQLTARDGGHDHGGGGHHLQSLVELNETEILSHHPPTPASYYSWDIVDPHPGEKRYPGLMALHALFMSLAFFGALPIGIALRSLKHASHAVAVGAFYACVILGLSTSALYRKLTPNMYQGSKHGSFGYFFIFGAVLLSALDILAFVLRVVHYARSIRNGSDTFAFSTLWHRVILGREESAVVDDAEYTSLVTSEFEAQENARIKAKNAEFEDIELNEAHPAVSSDDEHDETSQWAHAVREHRRQPSTAASDRTVFGIHSPDRRDSEDTLDEYISSRNPKVKVSRMRAIGRGTFAVAERFLVFAGFVQVLSGIVVYTGGCRDNYLNSCLAHLIKGGIFWCYGLVTFARFLGAFSELGWAWNRAPARYDRYPTAEFVECLVVFLYGITNTWMERFDARPGDPYTTKQVQHISIAVMFWFAGLVGMGIESKRVRRWLTSGAVGAARLHPHQVVEAPPSYIAGFNPFPALCIGITGAAMSAHFQTYVFQVEIHALWGRLLAGFTIMRCATYAFLWVAPPRSILPSRPPTEALAAFLLACGGLEFMFSVEDVTVAAMRQGRDDVMMFLNVGVAITCLAFCWVLGVVGFKAWMRSRTQRTVKFHIP